MVLINLTREEVEWLGLKMDEMQDNTERSGEYDMESGISQKIQRAQLTKGVRRGRPKLKTPTYRVITDGRKTTVTRRKILNPEGKGTITQEQAHKATKKTLRKSGDD